MARLNSTQPDPGIALTLGATRDVLASIRAVALLLTGERRNQVDQHALLMQIAASCVDADTSLAVVGDMLEGRAQR